MLIDSHCHLTSNCFGDDNLENILNKALIAGVNGFLNVSTNIIDCKLGLDLSKKYPKIIQTSIGIHPNETNNWNNNCIDILEKMLKYSNVRFVGEIGLDGYHDFNTLESQELAFRDQIRMAIRHKKPIIIHTRKVPNKTIDILREENASQVGGIIHCFSEDRAFARKALDLGFYLSFSGIITFKNAESIREVATWAPIDRIMIETDSPYLAPTPFRGKSNEPAMINYIVNKLAILRQITKNKLIEATAKNFKTLCNWLPGST